MGKANTLRDPGARRVLAADLAFLLALSAFLGCLHHALRADRPLFAAPRNPGYASLSLISAPALRQLLGQPGVVLVDARSEGVFRKETIPTSLSLPLHYAIDDAAMATLRGARRVIVFCGSAKCGASKEQALVFRSLGLQSVEVFEGGLEEWKRLGYPLSSKGP